MQKFDPSNAPKITQQFFIEQMVSAPPGSKPHTLYLGHRQLRELSELEPGADFTTATGPVGYREVIVVPVVAESHYLMTYVEIPEKFQILKQLVEFGKNLNAGGIGSSTDCEVKRLALKVEAAFKEELP